MSAPERLTTSRLVLRRWRESDAVPFAALNGDPEVMRFYPRTYGLEETKARIGVWMRSFAERGYAPWAVEIPGVAPCIGVVGPTRITGNLPLAGRMEILWRLARPYWGKGYAVEAARACLRDAFERLAQDEMLAYTATVNAPSRRVMEKLGMVEDPVASFLHPALPEGDRLRPHVVYRLAREDFLSAGAAA